MKFPRLIFTFLLFGSNLIAQEIDFGIKVGPNLSIVSGDLTENYNPRLGYHFGGFAEIEFSDKFSFQPEILYNSMGFILDSSIESFQNFGEPGGDEISFKSAQRSNFLSIPLALKLRFNSRLALEFGPQGSFLLNSVSKLKEAQGFESNGDRNSVSGDFKFDYGAVLGFGYSLNNKMSLQLRYYHGFSDIFENRIDNFKNYHRALQLSFGYKFL